MKLNLWKRTNFRPMSDEWPDCTSGMDNLRCPPNSAKVVAWTLAAGFLLLGLLIGLNL